MFLMHFDLSITPLVLSLSPPEHLHAFHHVWTADEMTVGKVYAALMIFDFYKQNKNSREQVHQPPGGLCQVLGMPLPVLPLLQLLLKQRAVLTGVTGALHSESLGMQRMLC